MNKHEHDKCCEHELAYCKVCDVVYCKKCNKEWGKKEYVRYPYDYPWIYEPYKTTWTNVDYPDAYPKITCDSTDAVCQHKT